MTVRAPMRQVLVVGAIALAAGCAAAIAPREDLPPAEPELASAPGAERSVTSAPPAKATDPEPGESICTGYSLDGVAIGMPRSQVEKISPLIAVPPASAIEGYENTTFAFKAVRRGRMDHVQVGFNPSEGEAEPAVGTLRARIFVSKTDAWPASLFAFLGSPKRARVGEWVWWNTECRFTLRLTRLSALGKGESQPYVLDIRRTATPPKS